MSSQGNAGYLVDTEGKLLGRECLQALRLCNAGGPDHIAVVVAHGQQRQRPRPKEALPRSVVGPLRADSGHNAPLVIAP